MQSMSCPRAVAVLVVAAGLAACSQPNDPAKLWTGRSPEVRAGGMHGAKAVAPVAPSDAVRTVASFDHAASAPLAAGTLVAR